jgi:hypothetical protein
MHPSTEIGNSRVFEGASLWKGRIGASLRKGWQQGACPARLPKLNPKGLHQANLGMNSDRPIFQWKERFINLLKIKLFRNEFLP